MTPAKQSSQPHSILKSVPYFSALDERTFEMVYRSAFRRSYETGQIILVEGQPSAGLFVIESGWLKVNKISIEGRELILKTIGPGESFSVVNVFSGEPNRANVEALEQTVVWLVPREAMLRLLDNNPDLAQLVIQDLAARVTHLIEFVEDLSLRSVELRLARLILENAGDDILERHIWATQAEMSARLGTVPEVLSRILRSCPQKGLSR